MTYEFSKKELDNALYNEFCKDKLDKKKIKALIEQGANINNEENYIGTNLFAAIVMHQIETEFNPDALQLLIDLGADINHEICDDCFNCLVWACSNSMPQMVEFLLKAGIDPNCFDKELNCSLLDWVIADNSIIFDLTEVIELLIKYGAKRKNLNYEYE
jgi:ankyrin repeat protein